MNGKPGPLFAPGANAYSYKTAARRAHAYGAKIFMQVAFGPGRMRNGKTPSVLPTLADPEKLTTALTAEEIERLIAGAIELCKFAKKNEYDGVELHAHFGYLLDQFEMECTNHRTDEYGGDLDGRLTVYRKLICGIKEACGEDFPVAIRMGLKSYMKSFTEADLTGENEFGRDIDETIEVCKRLEEYGIDLFDFNSGTYESHYYCTNPYYMPKGYNIELCRRAKAALHVPVFCVGLMDDPDMCEKAIADGSIDGMTICRAAMAEPNYVRKLESGNELDIRPCIQCCYCEHCNLTQGLVYCSSNPAVLNEREYGIPKAQKVKKVAVIGGGVAGMCAAHTAAVAGHITSIYDCADTLGGHLNAIAKQPFKSGVKKLRDWYVRQLEKLGVHIHTGACMDAEAIKTLDAEIVILAVGSQYSKPSITGIDLPNVISAYDFMRGEATVGERVAVIGGGCVGAECAYELAGRLGRQVTLAEKGEDIVASPQLSDDVRHMLSDLLKYKNAAVITGFEVTEITAEGVVGIKDGKKQFIPSDSVIYATGASPRESMARALQRCGKEIYEVGDGCAVGTIQTASAQAYEIARLL